MKIFWIVFLALLFLHQDGWNWGTEEIVWGGMPIGLFYHVLFSLACSGLGTWAVFQAWPKEWERYAEQAVQEEQTPDSQA